MADTKILQIGKEDWSQLVTIPETDRWIHTTIEALPELLESIRDEEIAKLNLTEEDEIPKINISFSGILLTDPVEEEELMILDKAVEAYSVYKLASVKLKTNNKQGFFRKKVVRSLDDTETEKQDIVNFLCLNLYSGQYGAKFKNVDMDISPNFKGTAEYNGHISTTFSGDFGEEMTQLYTYRYNLLPQPMSIDLWLEYTKSEGVEIELHVSSFEGQEFSNVLDYYVFDEEQMKQEVNLPKVEKVGQYAVSVCAKGQGELTIGNLHWRKSRMGLGEFILGGKRHFDKNRYELISYFNPGDMKPPLNVYFSGYRSLEGFEGFFIMKRMGAPFLLIGDPRLEGGSFYMGSQELENSVKKAINDALNYLDFDESQLTLSGLSMGTFGALYYAADFDPAAVLVGKPFTNVGDTVKNLKLKRPDEFDTSSDMLRLIMGEGDEKALEEINQRFWTKFGSNTFPNTTFALAFMEQDDYDTLATDRLIEFFADKEVHIIAKGYEGRHNDNSSAVNKWFLTQYSKILREKFGRK